MQASLDKPMNGLCVARDESAAVASCRARRRDVRPFSGACSGAMPCRLGAMHNCGCDGENRSTARRDCASVSHGAGIMGLIYNQAALEASGPGLVVGQCGDSHGHFGGRCRGKGSSHRKSHAARRHPPLCSLSFLAIRTQSAVFFRREAALHEALLPVEPVLGVRMTDEAPPDRVPNVVFLPIPQSSPAG